MYYLLVLFIIIYVQIMSLRDVIIYRALSNLGCL